MAELFYNLEVYNARPQGEIDRIGVKGTNRSGATNWHFQHTADEATEQLAYGTFLAAYATAVPTAPGHIDTILKTGDASLLAALTLSATTTNDAVATTGPWSEKLGKGVYGYKIGVSATDMADAVANTVAHDLA
jgi:hypothetical protein